MYAATLRNAADIHAASLEHAADMTKQHEPNALVALRCEDQGVSP
jgi:hypothetical protein